MDPQVTWQELLEAFAQEQWLAVHEAADALLAWLNRQGYPPKTTEMPALPATWHRAIARAACTFALRMATRATELERAPRPRSDRNASGGADGLATLRTTIERLVGRVETLTSAIDDLTGEVQWMNNQQSFEIALPSPPLANIAHDASAEP